MSFNTFIREGLLTVRSGSLGGLVADTLTGNIVLWTAYPEKSTYYVFDGGVANRTVTLPEILAATAASDTTRARLGHVITVKNSGTTNTIELLASDSSPITTIAFGNTATVIATASPVTWELLQTGGGGGGGGSALLSAVGDPNITIAGQTTPDIYDPADAANATITWAANLEELTNVTEVAPAVGDFIRLNSIGVPNQWQTFTPTTLTFVPTDGLTVTTTTGSLPYSPSSGTDVSITIGNPNALGQLTNLGGVTLTPNPWTSGNATITTNTQTVYDNDPALNLRLDPLGSGGFLIQDGGMVGTLFHITNNGATVQHFRVGTNGASLGTNSVAAGSFNIVLGSSPIGTMTANGNTSIVMTTANTTATITENQKIVKISPQGELLADSATVSGVTYTSSNVARWVADSVTTTGNVAGNFTKTLALPNDATYSMLCWLTGTRTNAPGVGESWSYRVFIIVKNIGGTITQTVTADVTIEEASKSLSNPFSLSNTNPTTFTVTPSGLTTEVIRWVLNVEYVRVSQV